MTVTALSTVFVCCVEGLSTERSNKDEVLREDDCLRSEEKDMRTKQ